jgi:hypothetical protein
MSLNEIATEINAGNLTSQQVLDLERGLVEIEFDCKIDAARAWASQSMVSRDELIQVEVGLQIEKVQALLAFEHSAS